MADMVSVLTGIGGALLGTAVGAFVTHFLQRRNASLARLHEERISAYVAFAEAVMEFRRELMDRWFV
jgi:ABC-type lipoprotein release transport system permease subunit